MNKEQHLTFNLGITNVPSDATCDDNALEECLGMVYDNGEHRPIQPPVNFATVDCDPLMSAIRTYASNVHTPSDIKFVYAHKYNDVTRYFFAVTWELRVSNGVSYEWREFVHVACGEYDAASGKIVLRNVLRNSAIGYGVDNILKYDDALKFCSLGKSVIVTGSGGMIYYQWRPNTITEISPSIPVMYKCLGSGFTEPKITFDMDGSTTFNLTYRQCSYKTVTASGLNNGSGTGRAISTDGQENWNNCAIGLYEKVRKDLWSKNLFVGPFCVRAAIEMTDGSYFLCTNPILMLNTFDMNCVVSIDGNKVMLAMFGQDLTFKANYNYKQWSDIIKGVSLFVTREHNLFDTTTDAILDWATDDSSLRDRYYIEERELHVMETYYSVNDKYVILEKNPISDLKTLVEDGLYYHLCDIGLVQNGVQKNAADYMDSHTLENLTTRTRLTDDYMSHAKLYPSKAFVYNKRLNIASVSRGFYDGFTQFLPYNDTFVNYSPQERAYDIYVTIETDTGNYVVKKSFTSNDVQGLFFYYPDRRAKHVVIQETTAPASGRILDADLKEHPSLNGAYYFHGIATYIDSTTHKPRIVIPTASSYNPLPTPTPNARERLLNTLITSSVNNPFIFPSKGYNDVGTGKVIDISSNTQALSQGQHGQFPLLVFTTEGIWALSVTDEGWLGAEDPMSREVALENNPCITQTDDAVFFATAKGLMKTDGSAVACVSEQLRDIAGFIRSAFIVYDYRDSLLWLIQNDRIYEDGQPCYVYSIKNGTFSRYVRQQPQFGSAISLYPDVLFCDVEYNVSSIMNKPNDVDDEREYAGEIVSRPIKFENGLALKSLRDLKLIKDMQEDAHVTVTIQASNDLRTWKVLKSFRGMPYKYFKIGLAFSDMKATDRFAGLVAITQERRTNKLR